MRTLAAFVFLLFFNFSYANIISNIQVSSPVVFKNPVVLSKQYWNTNLELSIHVFEKNIHLENIKSDSIIKSNASSFLKNIKISNTKNYKIIESIFSFFKENIYLYNLTSYATINLDSSSFDGQVLFSNVDCFGSLLLRMTKFSNILTIEHSNIKKINISNALFNDDFKVINSVFEKDFNAQNASFNNNVLFNLVKFEKGLNLSGSKFNKNIEFNKVVVNDFLDLSNITANTIDLTNISSKNTIKLNISNSKIKNLKADFNDFELVFSNNLDFNEISAIYEKLLKDNSQSPSNYRQIFLQYNKFKHNHNQNPWLNNFLETFWNYGLDKSRPFTWLGWIFLFFTCTNAIFYPEISKKCLSISFLPDGKEESIDKNPITRLVYYLPYSIFLTIFLFLSSFILSLRVLFPVTIRKDQLLKISQSKRMIILSYFFSIILLGYAYILFLFAFLINPESS
jgi:hypothetical protein